MPKELQLDEVNSLKAAMKELDRKKRSVTVAILTAIFGVAAFGTAFRSWASLSQVKDSLNTGLQKQDALIEEVDAQLLRVADVTNFVVRQYNEIVTHVKELEHLTRREIANRLDHFLHLMLTSFRLGLQDFMSGLTDLMHHRLSPLLVASANLEAAFDKLVESAQRQGLKPLTRDVGILFQAATSTFADAKGRLFAVVHVPLYTGERLHLYKYIPAPFFLRDTRIMLTVESPAEYLALDAHQTVGKQLTTFQFQLCTKSAEILHCPHLNLLTKGLKRLCLYNLFVQNPDDIEETCEVKVSQLKTHAVQVGASTYRLLTAIPTQLVTECEDGTNNTLVDGAHMVEFSDRCPIASTNEFVFARTPSLYQRHRLVNIPL